MTGRYSQDFKAEMAAAEEEERAEMLRAEAAEAALAVAHRELDQVQLTLKPIDLLVRS